MKRRIVFFLALLFFNVTIAQVDQNVKAFLPEVFSQFPNVRDLAISPDGNEIYFTIQSYLDGVSAIACSKKIDNKWTEIQLAKFSGKANDMEPFFQSDGLKLYFVSNRSLADESSKIKDYDIWFVERKNLTSEWSKPINMGAPVNSAGNEFYPSLAENGNLYFTSGDLSAPSKGKDDIFICTYKNGKYADPVSLSDSINTAGYEFNAVVASDESYLIYTGYSRADGSGSGDLYISYKNKKDEWGQSVNLGKQINTDKMEYCPFVDEKNSMLYFTSKRNSVKAVFEKSMSLPELQAEMNKYENGLSRIYTVDAKTILNK